MRKTRSGQSYDLREAIVREKLCFQNAFCPHENEKLGFRDGLVWAVGLTVENKAAFSNSSGVLWALTYYL